MGQFTVSKDGEKRVYKDGNKFAAADKVPEAAKKALEEGADGLVVDDLGDRIDPNTESDESADEDLSDPSTPNTNADNQDDADEADDADELDDDAPADDEADDEEEADKPAPKPRNTADKKSAEQKAVESQAADGQPVDNSPVPQDEAGMGFPRKNGKTLSVFGTKPHETVKHVAGVLVPLTHEEYNTKSDADIIAQLRKLGPKKAPQPQL